MSHDCGMAGGSSSSAEDVQAAAPSIPADGHDGLSTALFISPPIGERPGDQIGPYRLLSVLGEGGFGVVYLAERRSPHVQRVALKIIKPGMDSRAVIARFEAERQALAMMDHANVARVFDAGATVGGRPYFVMEHVQGEPITVYCDRHNLTIKQRLELFIPVCEAVQHAHMKGIIHRDIKPSNILVMVKDGETSGGAIPKVIDFGVAKAISHTLTDKTIFTEQGQIIGTPEYMSPEQAEMGAMDIDTRTDVYSLGVVLYELLTGLLPFDSRELRSKGYAEIQRIIREVEPPKPSTRLTSLREQGTKARRHEGTKRESDESDPLASGSAGGDAENGQQREPSAINLASRRQTQIDQLARELRRELEWIPMMAMRKDRMERYATAKDLAEDIGHYLEGEALEAGPEGVNYRLRKFLLRNKKSVTVTIAFIVLLGFGLITVSFSLIKAKREAERADLEAVKVLQVALREQERLQAFWSFVLGQYRQLSVLIDQAPPGTFSESDRAPLIALREKLYELSLDRKKGQQDLLEIWPAENTRLFSAIKQAVSDEELNKMAAFKEYFQNKPNTQLEEVQSEGWLDGMTQKLITGGRFKQAEQLLVKYYQRDFLRNGPSHSSLEDINTLLIDVYAAWHAAEPDNGYDAKAAEWRAKLEAIKAEQTKPTNGKPSNSATPKQE